MRRHLSKLALLACALVLPLTAHAQKKFVPLELKTSKLPNGLTVVRIPFKSPGLFSYYSIVGVGSRNEVEEGHTGFAHFFEHMMFKGTPTYPEGEREKIIGTFGFDDNAFTSDDFTAYHSTGPSSALEKLIELEADRFKHLTYVEPSFRTEALAVLGEYHKNAAMPELKLEETMLATAFQKHTYRHSTLGFYEDIKKMPEYYEYSKQFFQRWYTPDNTTLLIVGDFDDQKLMAAIEKHYGDWKGKKANVKIPVEPPQREPGFGKVSWEGPALPRQMFAWRTPAASLANKDTAAQEVLVAYLVGPTSDLHRELVLEKQIVESIGSWWYPHRDPYLFTLDAKLKDEKHRGAVVDAFNKQIRALVSNKVDTKRVDAIKSNIRYGLLMGLESPKEVAGQVAYYIGMFGAPDALERHLQNVSKVTAADLVRLAKEYLTANRRNEIVLVQSKGGAK